MTNLMEMFEKLAF